jgi:hypothetical protein
LGFIGRVHAHNITTNSISCEAKSSDSSHLLALRAEQGESCDKNIEFILKAAVKSQEIV